MVSVPVQAMYTAKQYIAELTVYSFATTTLKAAGLWYMVTHPGIWLWQYGLMLCLLTVTPQLIIALRGFWLFPECRFRWRRALEGRRVRAVASFAGWLLVGSLGLLVRVQGVQVLINKFFGPAANAAMTVANTLNANTLMLAGAMVAAFQPAIVQAYGAGERERMLGLSYRACKFASIFLLVFMLPLALEVDEVLRLWLVNPPMFAGGLCLLTFGVTLLDMCTVGHRLVLVARGKMALYQTVVGLTEVTALPIALAVCWMGSGVYGINGSVLGVMAVAVWLRVLFARQLTGMSVLHWLWKVMGPVWAAVAAGAAAGWAARSCLPASFGRVAATTAVCNGVFLGLAWGVILDAREKRYVLDRVGAVWKRVAGGDGK
jgi:O-antigen/teichoic acid export membrane protein